jgi:hypothetical protein
MAARNFDSAYQQIQRVLPHVGFNDGPDGQHTFFFGDVRATDDGRLLWSEEFWDADEQSECDCVACRAARRGEFHPTAG